MRFRDSRGKRKLTYESTAVYRHSHCFLGKRLFLFIASNTNTMVPRLNLLRAAAVRPSSQSTSIASFLVPFLHPSQQHTRHASVLSSLSDVSSAYNKRIRRGRGASSGKGKTSGRGHKGQKQHGKVPKNMNGGQTPLEVVHGVRGFENQYEDVSLAFRQALTTFAGSRWR